MMDLALLLVGILAVATMGACAYGLFLVRDAVDDTKSRLDGIDRAIAGLPAPAPPTPPVDLSTLEERVGLNLALTRVIYQKHTDVNDVPTPSPAVQDAPAPVAARAAKLGRALIRQRLATRQTS